MKDRGKTNGWKIKNLNGFVFVVTWQFDSVVLIDYIDKHMDLLTTYDTYFA